MSEFEAITAGERERTYRFLSGLCLKPPSDSLIAMIRDGSILSVFQDNYEDGEGIESYPAGLFEFVRQAEKMPNLKEELEADHTALFVLPSDLLPHEAVYLDKDKKLGGRITISVGQFYEKAGADILKECTEMPDHLGMELEFMAFLCGIERESWEKTGIESLQKCVEFQKMFLEEHLLKWVYRCCEKIIERAEYGFYKAVANFIIEFMKSEEEYVSELYAKVCKEGEEICETVA
ncbi:MAG: TorD/DmsD family molecular chaperone [Nitrospirota bacterium]